MYSTYGQELKARLLKVHGYSERATRGCTEEEIQTLMQAQGVDFLPEVYRQFLLVMGHDTAHMIFRGSDVTFNYLLRLKGFALHRITDEAEYYPSFTFQLPEDAFVFHMHQGYTFCYFLTSTKEDNPAVYSFHEGKGEPVKMWQSLTDFFDQDIEVIKQVQRDPLHQLQKRPKND